MPMDQFQGLLQAMQVDAQLRLVNYFHGATLVYDAGLAQKIVARISRNLANKMSTTAGYKAVEGAKAAELIRSTVSEIMDAVTKAMSAHAASAGISDGIVGAVKDRATQLAVSAFGPAAMAQATPILSLLPVCPLMGSYMLASAPYFNTSDFVALAAGRNTLASVDEIERIAIGNVNPLRLYASRIIVESKINLRHQHRSDINEVMEQAGLRAKAAEAKTLKGRARKYVADHLTEPLKKKWRALRA